MSVVKKWFVQWQPLLSMLLVQLFSTGNQLLGKIILNEGIFIFALMAYRHAVATICIVPLAFFLERGCAKKLSWSAGFWLFVTALVGILLAMGLYYYGLKDTTATYATNFLNLIPVATFILSALVGMEKVQPHTRTGKLKSLGAIICVSGALCAGLLDCGELHIGHHTSFTSFKNSPTKHYWVRGSFFLVGSCLCYSLWFIIQAKLIKVFPYKYWATMLSCVIAAVQSAVVGLCMNRQYSAWRLKWDLQLITILYSGAFSTAATFCLINWVIKIKGPTFAPMFNPLALIFVAVLETFLLGQDLNIGMIVGTVLIVMGLYLFLWGKTKESKSLIQQTVADDETSTTSIIPECTAVVVPSANSSDEEQGRPKVEANEATA